MQKMFRSFIKNGKERKNIAFFWKEGVPNPALYSSIAQIQSKSFRLIIILLYLPVCS